MSAGSATLQFGFEDTFMGSVTGAPDYYKFGRNPSVDSLSLDNQLTRMYEAGTIENVENVKGNFEGAFTVSAVANEETFDEVNQFVFNDGGSGFTTGRANSIQVLAGTEHLDPLGTNTKIRELKGVIPTEFEVSYEQGDMVRFTATCLYADEDDGATAGSLTTPASGQDAAFHNVIVNIDGTQISKLQSASISFSNLYRLQYGNFPTPIQAVLAQPEVTVTTEAIYEGATFLEDAYGAAAATTPQTRMDSEPGTFDIDISGTTVALYEFAGLKPDITTGPRWLT
jgi:hypothetical protein